MDRVRATFRVVPTDGIVTLPLSAAPGMTGLELEKWKFENITTGIDCVEFVILEGKIRKYDIGNLADNAILLHFDGTTTANMASDANTKEVFRLMSNSSSDTIRMLVRDGNTKAPITFDALQLWLTFFIV